MNILSRRVDYAVNVLCFIAVHEPFVRVTDLRKELDMPHSFTREIMRLLARAGILASTRGKTGGFTLAMTPDKINVGMVMKAFGELGREDKCTFKKKECPRKGSCRLRSKIMTVEKTIFSLLQKITIASLVKSEMRNVCETGRRKRRL